MTFQPIRPGNYTHSLRREGEMEEYRDDPSGQQKCLQMGTKRKMLMARLSGSMAPRPRRVIVYRQEPNRTSAEFHYVNTRIPVCISMYCSQGEYYTPKYMNSICKMQGYYVILSLFWSYSALIYQKFLMSLFCILFMVWYTHILFFSQHNETELNHQFFSYCIYSSRKLTFLMDPYVLVVSQMPHV